MSAAESALPLGQKSSSTSCPGMRPAPKAALMDLSKVSLLSLCRAVVVSNLERYPPEAFGICSEEDFDALIRLRHKNTTPKNGHGGLDGTGRVAPAVSDKFMKQIEDTNPHLAESQTVDVLVWKDCVEYRFQRGGHLRPKALLLPWPSLVKQVVDTATSLQKSCSSLSSPMESSEVQNIIDELEKMPMNVSLLKATSVGKTIKKILKRNKDASKTTQYHRLEELILTWMKLAEESGVKMADAHKQKPTKKAKMMDVRKPPPSEALNNSISHSNVAEDLQLAETCQQWRQLFALLKKREEERRSEYATRMRERRKNLASNRPKVVKVRPTSAKQANILARSAMRHGASLSGSLHHASSTPGASKMLQLRKESSIAASRQRSDPSQPVRKASGFASAVAFAACSKRTVGTKKHVTNHVKLSNGKQMNVPSRVVQGTGAPRQLASKFKKFTKK